MAIVKKSLQRIELLRCISAETSAACTQRARRPGPDMALPVLVLPAMYALAREVVGTASHQAGTSVMAFETVSLVVPNR